MAFNSDDTKLSAYEDVVRQIRGVVSARVVASNAGEIAEIHVLAEPDRNPKQVVRDIESVFMVTYGCNIDHKKISVAQLKDEDGDLCEFNQAGSKPCNIRPQIISITMVSGGRIAETKVKLEVAGNCFEGSATGPGTAANKLRLISQAALVALENYFKGTGSFLTEDVSLINISGYQAVVVSVSLITNTGEERLIGAAFVNNDDKEAAVKATLAAVNRRLDVLL